MRRAFALPALSLVLGLLSGPLLAQESFPSKPIRLVAESVPGGIIDIWGRRIAQRMSESMSAPVVVDNRPGASGTIAAEAVVKAPADGHTLLYGGIVSLVMFPGAGGRVRYDPVRDFVPVGLGPMGYQILAVNSRLGPKTFQEAVAHSKAEGGSDGLVCGTGGQASPAHFGCELIARASGMRLRSVHYKGGAQAVLDAANGSIPFVVDSSSTIEQFVLSGRLIPIAVFGPNRLPKYPAAPTTGELGFQGLELPGFQFAAAPAGTPVAIQERLLAEFNRAMSNPQVVEWYTGAGGFWRRMTLAELGEFVGNEQQTWRRRSEQTGIRVEP